MLRCMGLKHGGDGAEKCEGCKRLIQTVEEEDNPDTKYLEASFPCEKFIPLAGNRKE